MYGVCTLFVHMRGMEGRREASQVGVALHCGRVRPTIAGYYASKKPPRSHQWELGMKRCGWLPRFWIGFRIRKLGSRTVSSDLQMVRDGQQAINRNRFGITFRLL